jgi:CheY-like chemotaxis protein
MVLTVKNGRDAVAAAEKQSFDLALLDLQMPEMDGLEAVALIRQNEKATGRCRLPVIALTAHAMRGDRERCIAAGMDGYISKPINRKELFTVIQNVLQTYHHATNPVLPPDDRPFPGALV